MEDDGTYEGVDGVIDKDLAAAVLARDIQADQLIILTSVEKVALHFGTEQQVDLDLLTLSEAKTYFAQGEFPPGSMGPKIEAAVQFLEQGGKEVLITSVEHMTDGRHSATGTHIIQN